MSLCGCTFISDVIDQAHFISKKDKIDLPGGSLLILQAALLGLNQVLIKLVNAGLQPVFQAGLRSAFAIIPILAFALFMRRRLTVRDGSLPYGLACGLLFSVEFVFVFLALDYTTVARVSVLFYTMPVWFTLAASVLLPGEHLTRSRVVGLILSVCGITVAMFDRLASQTDGLLLGDLFALAASVCWAAIAMLCRATPLKNSSSEMQLLYQLSTSAMVLLPLSYLFGDQIREMTTELAWIFAFQVVIVVAFGFSLWFWILSIYPASATASYSFLAPVFGVFFGWLILAEKISFFIVIALVLVCIGIVLINRNEAKPSTSSD